MISEPVEEQRLSMPNKKNELWVSIDVEEKRREGKDPETIADYFSDQVRIVKQMKIDRLYFKDKVVIENCIE